MTKLKSFVLGSKNESGAAGLEVKTLLRELARILKKDIYEYYGMDWEV